MIYDEHVDSQATQVGNLFVGICAAVQRHEQSRPLRLKRAIDRTARKTVAISRSPWHDKLRIESESPQNRDQQRRAAYAVDVIIAQNDHRFAPRDRRAQAIRASLEIAQKKRIPQRRQRRLEKLCG